MEGKTHDGQKSRKRLGINTRSTQRSNQSHTQGVSMFFRRTTGRIWWAPVQFLRPHNKRARSVFLWCMCSAEVCVCSSVCCVVVGVCCRGKCYMCVCVWRYFMSLSPKRIFLVESFLIRFERRRRREEEERKDVQMWEKMPYSVAWRPLKLMRVGL